MPIPYPRGYEKRRLQEQYYRKTNRARLESLPIGPDELLAVKSQLNEENYRWLYLSVWLGLRPIEVDQTKDDRFVKIQRSPDGQVVMWIYQTKLTSRPPWQRWKLIPILFEEQSFCIEIIKDKAFKRPSVRTVRRLFGDQVSLYAGRKGFTDLMLSRNQNFVDISQWMGHCSIERTWRHYKNRMTVHFRAAG